VTDTEAVQTSGSSSDGGAKQETSNLNSTTATSTDTDRMMKSDAALQLYRRLLKHKRAAHLDAIQRIVSLNSDDKQRKMLKAIFSKLFVVLVDAKVRIAEYAFTPGDPFPTDSIVMDVFSTILENTAFLGDLVLRLPDIAHELLDSNSDWRSLTHWAVAFTNDSNVFVNGDGRVIHMMAQELGLIEKDQNFVNPYKKETQVEQIIDTEMKQILAEQKRKLLKKEKKEQKKKMKGPRMSVPRHIEL
jgi:hypothetical protein